MVSIGTQTEDEFYCYSLAQTSPSDLYSVSVVTGLHQLSSRLPPALSPSADAALADIELAHTCEAEDTYYDDRQYEMVYEEVLLRRTCSQERLGLTLCYGSLEDELTDIFISEVDPDSIAGKDGRITEGDQIVQINGVDVRSRSEAIALFAGNGTDISLTVARPQLQFDDGYMEDASTELEELQIELLGKHHHMHLMASMLAMDHIDEENTATDTTTTEASPHRHEKYSRVGPTDDSTRHEESCQQETDYDSLSLQQMMVSSQQDPSESNCLPGDVADEICARLHKVLDLPTQSHLQPHLTVSNKELENMQVKYEDLCDNQLQQQQQHMALVDCTDDARGDNLRTNRVVPRMGTRLEYSKHLLESAVMRKSGQVTMSAGNVNSNTISNPGPAFNDICSSSLTATMLPTFQVANSELNSNTNISSLSSGTSRGVCNTWITTTAAAAITTTTTTTSTSVYNTGKLCCNTPLTLELVSTSQEGHRLAVSSPVLCLAIPSNSSSAVISSDTEKQTQTPTKARDYSSDDSGHGQPKGSSVSHAVRAVSIAESMKAELLHQAHMGESLQDLYLRCADIMYTNRANLQHTIAVQQKLFHQQLQQQARLRGRTKSPGQFRPDSAHDFVSDKVRNLIGQTTPCDSGQMQWVVKRRPDGTRYITRRPVRSKLLKERAKKISEERSGMTTDDDAMSEMKTGRYWSKEDRKRHLEKAKDYKKKKELLAKAKLEILKEAEDKKEMNIIELSHRKMMKHKGKKVLDNFTTVKEMLAHGSKVGDSKPYNPLLSVTTV